MARLLFPHERVLLGTSQQAGRPVVSLAGGSRTIYSDPAHTILADITDTDGNSIAGSKLTIDHLSRLPEFMGPDGVAVVYDDSGNTYYPVIEGSGPPGPAGPPGPTGQTGARRWHGSGPPPDFVEGAAPGDEYLDDDTLDLYVLS